MDTAMIDRAIRFGPFEVHHLLGRGSMGEVWRGLHVAQQIPVAIKVLTSEQARSSEAREAFDAEVRAVARLHHPGIVHILDYGAISAEAERASSGRLPAGSPALAMQLASEGTLPRPKQPWDWWSLRALLLDLLDALAHAHARGVIHRDIKPANILVSLTADGRKRFILSDFGIARAIGIREDKAGVVSGTPHYMAPEQILNRLHAQGPWTDLYSVGCLAYQFATARYLFPGVTGTELLAFQLSNTPTPIDNEQLPKGFQRWLDRMLAKHPRDRFQFAADAAYSLTRLDGGSVPAMPTTPALSQNSADEAGVEELFADNVGDTIRAELQQLQPDAPQLGTLAEIFFQPEDFLEPVSLISSLASDSPPCPKTWRRTDAGRPPPPLVGAGLGLYGLRTVPLVNRDAERDHIWSMLLEVNRNSSARAVLLQGSAGYGKSRVVEWISHRAHELGAAIVLRAGHSPIAGQVSGLAPMLASHLGCAGADREEMLDRVQSFLEEQALPNEPIFRDDQAALVELMLSARSGDELVKVHFATPRERYAVITRFIARLCRLRPVILWLDDVQWGADALAFASYLLETQEMAALPVLILATSREDGGPTARLEKQRLNEFCQSPRVQRMSIGPLEADHHRTLVAELLGLESELLEHVAQRTGGNPLFAIQLIGDWVARGVLMVGERGFRLRPGERGELPDNIHELWLRRIAQLFQDSEEATNVWLVLEIAATLGQDFLPQEWHLACGVERLLIPPGMLDVMLTHRLLEQRDNWLTFVHGMLRESLDRAARDSGRHIPHHLACAKMLEQLYPHSSSAVAERRAAHLIEANELEAAAEPLLLAGIALTRMGDFGHAIALFGQRHTALMAVGVPAEDQRWGEGWVHEARALNSQGHTDEGELLVKKVIRGAQQHGWLFVAAMADRELGFLKIGQGDTAGAIAAYRDAYEGFEPFEATIEQADCLLGIGRAYHFRHELDAAKQYLEAAIEMQRKIGDVFGLGQSLKNLANVFQAMGDHARAVDGLEQAQRLFEQNGYRFQLGAVLNDLGETWRAHGHFDEAEACYAESASIFEQVGSTNSTPRLNLGLLQIMRGRYSEAEATYQRERRRAESIGQLLELPWIYAGLLTCSAARRNWPEFTKVHTALAQQLEDTGIVDDDISTCSELAGQLALQEQQPALARLALEIAYSQLSKMNDHEGIQRVTALLAR